MGRIPDEDRTGKQDVKRLAPHHREMARYAIQGMRPKDIANKFGMSPNQVSRVINSEAGRAYIAELELLAEEQMARSSFRRR